MAMTLLEKVKRALRVTTAAFDEAEVEPCIAAARQELKLAGVLPAKADAQEPDVLVYMAILSYAKGHFGINNPDADAFKANFEDLKQSMTLRAEYTAEPEE